MVTNDRTQPRAFDIRGGRRPADAPHQHADPQLRPVTPSTVADLVASQLRDLIAAGEYKAGDRLPSERNLAVRLGVGRPAVREALRELKSQGLLVAGRGAQGTLVAAFPTPRFGEPIAPLLGKGAEHLAELMELRSAVEIEAAGLAARRATLEDLHDLTNLVPGMGEVISPENDMAFHAAVAEATHNPLFQRVIGEPVHLLYDQMAAILSAFYAEPGGAVAIQQQHDAIRQAVTSGNEQSARNAMRRHLDYVSRGLAQLAGTGRLIRLAIIDLDGTLLAGPRHVTDRTRRTVAEVREAGVEVVLASARAPRAMRPYHEQLGLTAAVIACNGALLWNVLAGVGLAHLPVKPGLAGEIVQIARQFDAIVNIESDDEWFTDSLSEIVRQSILTYGLPQPQGIGNVDEMLRAGEPIDKVFVDLRDLDEETRTRARAAIRRTFAERTTMYETVPGIIDLVSPEASKATMAQQLARRMEIPAEQIIAIGDHDNDVTLLQWAGIGVAMGNATPAAKAAADVVTSSNLRDGVAEALERWVLRQRRPVATGTL